MAAYYNEIDPYAAQWLRNLIEAGHIAPGVVDERSIEDVRPSDLAGFTQCHFFAGVGVWSHALRAAGWADDVPVWTGSCPCQPFSSAGAGAGFEDARHLWPTFAWLIKQCKPAVVFGEQVASKAVEPWVDLVHADVEAMDYAFGAVPFPSAGVGAPHIRDRLFWVAQSEHGGRKAGKQKRSWPGPAMPPGIADGLADTKGDRHQRAGKLDEPTGRHGTSYVRPVVGMASSDSVRLKSPPVAGIHDTEHHAKSCGGSGGMGHTEGVRREGECLRAGPGMQKGGAEEASDPVRPGPVNGLWADADWLGCRDGKWRPVEPGTFPLAHGATSRVGRLRAYGNAINAQAATQFIAAYLET